MGKGFKQPLRPESKAIWEAILNSTAHYLLTLRTNNLQLLSTHARKIFVIGFVITIKSTVAMATEMFTMEITWKITWKYCFHV